jgi:hypothetical protein
MNGYKKKDAVEVVVSLNNPDGSYTLKFDKYVEFNAIRRMLRFEWSEIYSVTYIMPDRTYIDD